MLNLLWGVKAFYYEGVKGTNETIAELNANALEQGYVAPGDFVINLSSMPASKKGKTNTLRISQI